MCLSSIKPNTWTTSISTSFMNFESLWLRMGFMLILCQILVIRFKLFSSNKMASKLCIIVTLKWDDCKSKLWSKNNASTTLPLSPSLRSTQKVAFKTFTWKVKNSLCLNDVYSPKLGVDDTQNNHHLMPWEMFFPTQTSTPRLLLHIPLLVCSQLVRMPPWW